MDFVETAALCVLAARYARRQAKKKRKIWVKSRVQSIYDQRLVGKFHTFYFDLREHPSRFFKYCRMSVDSFDELLSIVGPSITYKDTHFRLSVPPEKRLMVTLRYFATGTSFNTLATEFQLGPSTVRSIVRNTSDALWNVLQPLYMAPKTEENWIDIANQFYDLTDFPNVIGAVDGKHITIKQPAGKIVYIVLMAWIDANYNFIFIEIVSYDSISDSNVFRSSNMGKKLKNGELNIPKERHLPKDENGSPMPFVLVTDDAAGLSTNILRPFPKRNSTEQEKIFNSRHHKAKHMTECAFGILASKWQIFYRPIDVQIEFCEAIVKACCILQNFVHLKDGVKFSDTLYECPLRSVPCCGVRGSVCGKKVRNYFMNYFTSQQ